MGPHTATAALRPFRGALRCCRGHRWRIWIHPAAHLSDRWAGWGEHEAGAPGLLSVGFALRPTDRGCREGLRRQVGTYLIKCPVM